MSQIDLEVLGNGSFPKGKEYEVWLKDDIVGELRKWLSDQNTERMIILLNNYTKISIDRRFKVNIYESLGDILISVKDRKFRIEIPSSTIKEITFHCKKNGISSYVKFRFDSPWHE
ncbi:MAG: hypothetical protein QXU98_01675 [Candidatus Parvarchaeota archaeon]